MSSQADIYKDLNDFFGDSPINFFNHGYHPVFDNVKDLPFKNQLSLYLKAIENLNVEEKNILEVGCGRGGGSKWIIENTNVSTYHSCDITSDNITFCKKTNNHHNAIYTVADAMNLPYPDESFDIVLNIESSHGYENIDLFFENVNRVLKKNGTFVLMDLYGISEKALSSGIRGIHTILESINKFFDIELEYITENVRMAQSECLNDSNLMQYWTSDKKYLEKMFNISKKSSKHYAVLFSAIGAISMLANNHCGFVKIVCTKK